MATEQDRIQIMVEYLRNKGGADAVVNDLERMQRRLQTMARNFKAKGGIFAIDDKAEQFKSNVQGKLATQLQQAGNNFAKFQRDQLDTAVPVGSTYEAARKQLMNLDAQIQKMSSRPITMKGLNDLRMQLEALQRVPLLGGSLDPAKWQPMNQAASQIATSISRLRQELGQLQGQLQKANRYTQDLSTVKRILTREMDGVSRAARTQARSINVLTREYRGNVFMSKLMSERSEAVKVGLDVVGGAAAGLLAGASLLQGSLMGTAFSLIFLKFSAVSVAVPVIALTVAIGGLAKILIAASSAAKTAQTALFQFSQLTGSMRTAMGAMGLAEEIARDFGFGIDEARGAITELIKTAPPMGKEVTQAAMDLASATGKDLTESMRVVTQAIGYERGNLLALREAHIKVDQATAETVNQMDRQARAAFVTQKVMENFGGASEERLKTLGAQVGRLTSNFKALFEAIGAPIVRDVLVPLIRAIANLVSGVVDTVKAFTQSAEFAKEWGRFLAAGRDLARELGLTSEDAGESIGVFLVRAMLLAIRAGTILLITLQKIVAAGKAVYNVIKLTLPVFKALWDVVRIVASFLKELIDRLIGLKNLQFDLLSFIDNFIAALLRLLAALDPGLIGRFIDNFLAAFRSLAGRVAGLLDEFLVAFENEIAAVRSWIDNVLRPTVDNWLTRIKAIFDDFIDGLLRFIDDVARRVRGWLDNLLAALSDGLAALRSFIDDLADALSRFLDNIGLGRFIDDLGRFIDDIARAFRRLFYEIDRFGLPTALRGFAAELDNALATLLRAIREFVDRLPAAVRMLADDVWRAFRGLVDNLRGALDNLRPIADDMRSSFDNLLRVLRNFLDNLAQIPRNILGDQFVDDLLRPFRRLVYELGRFDLATAFRGFITELDNSISALAKTIGRASLNLFDNFLASLKQFAASIPDIASRIGAALRSLASSLSDNISSIFKSVGSSVDLSFISRMFSHIGDNIVAASSVLIRAIDNGFLGVRLALIRGLYAVFAPDVAANIYRLIRPFFTGLSAAITDPFTTLGRAIFAAIRIGFREILNLPRYVANIVKAPFQAALAIIKGLLDPAKFGDEIGKLFSKGLTLGLSTGARRFLAAASLGLANLVGSIVAEIAGWILISHLPISDALKKMLQHALSGAITGGQLGAIGGPPGALVGAIIGAIVGAFHGAGFDFTPIIKEAIWDPIVSALKVLDSLGALVKDIFTLNLDEIAGDISEFFFAIGDVFDTISTAPFDAAMAILRQLGDAFNTFLTLLPDNIEDPIRRVVDGIIEPLQYLKDFSERIGLSRVLDSISNPISLLFSALGQFSAVDFSGIFDPVMSAIDRLLGSFDVLRIAFGPLFNSFIETVQFWSQKWVELFDVANTAFRNFWNGLLSVAAPALDAVKETAIAFWGPIRTVFTEATEFITSLWSRFWGLFKSDSEKALGETSGKVNEWVADIKAIIQPFVEFIKTAFESAFDFIVDVVKGSLQVLLGIIQIALGLILGPIVVFLDLLRGDWKQAWEDIKVYTGIVWDGINNVVKGALTVLNAIVEFAWAVIKGGTKAALDELRAIVAFSWDVLKAGAESAWEAIKQTIFFKLGELALGGIIRIGEFITQVGGVFIRFVADMYTLGGRVVTAFVDGLWDRVESLADRIQSVGGAIKSKLEDGLGWLMPGSPSVLGLETGQGFIDGMVQTISSGLSTVHSLGASVTDQIAAGIASGAGAVQSAVASLIPSNINIGTLFGTKTREQLDREAELLRQQIKLSKVQPKVASERAELEERARLMIHNASELEEEARRMRSQVVHETSQEAIDWLNREAKARDDHAKTLRAQAAELKASKTAAEQEMAAIKATIDELTALNNQRRLEFDLLRVTAELQNQTIPTEQQIIDYVRSHTFALGQQNTATTELTTSIGSLSTTSNETFTTMNDQLAVVTTTMRDNFTNMATTMKNALADLLTYTGQFFDELLRATVEFTASELDTMYSFANVMKAIWQQITVGVQNSWTMMVIYSMVALRQIVTEANKALSSVRSAVAAAKAAIASIPPVPTITAPPAPTGTAGQAVNITITDSVVTNQAAMNQLAQQVSNAVGGKVSNTVVI